MLRPDAERKARNIVPMWLLDSENPALARMAKRPVGVDIDELGVSLTAELKELSLTHARVMPDSNFFLCRSVYVEIRFRYESTVYTLSGDAQPSLADNSFVFEFDSVARKTMDDLGRRLKALGVLDASRAQPSSASPCQQSPAEYKSGRKLSPKVVARRMRHLPPPGGIERRVSHRYDLDCAAQVALVRDGKSMQAILVDMSRTGCRLYFETPCALEIGLQVEVQFTENGFPLRLGAIVQGSANAFSAGLRFMHNSPRMTERLDNLLWEMAELSAAKR